MIQRHVIGPTRVKGQHKFDWVGDGGFGLIEREKEGMGGGKPQGNNYSRNPMRDG